MEAGDIPVGAIYDLMNEDLPEGKSFRNAFPSLTILNPTDFLQSFM